MNDVVIKGHNPTGKAREVLVYGPTFLGKIGLTVRNPNGKIYEHVDLDHHAAHELARAIQRVADQRKQEGGAA